MAWSASRLAEETDISLSPAALLTSVAYGADHIHFGRWTNSECECPEYHHPKLDDIPQKRRQDKQARCYPVLRRESREDCPAKPFTAHPI